MLGRPAALAQPIIPPVWDILADDFESGSLGAWQQELPENLYPAPGAGLWYTPPITGAGAGFTRFCRPNAPVF